jgi:hypothetical protein
MNEASLVFWLSKFVGANSNGNRYPARTLYCIVSDPHLSDIKGNETVNILDKNDRRYF